MAPPAGMVVAQAVVSLVVSMVAPDWNVQAGSAGLRYAAALRIITAKGTRRQDQGLGG